MDRLTAMEALVRVVETGSFSGAARPLHVGQPAVSKTIAQLEGRLGVRLLLKSSRGLSPTEAGQNFYKRAKRSIEEADEAEFAAREAGNGLAGRLQRHGGGNPHTEGQCADHGGGGVARGGLCRPRVVRRLRMAVSARSRQRQGQAGIAGLDPAVDGFVGGIPDRPPRQRESARLHRLRRGSVTPDQLRGPTRPSGKRAALR